MVLFIISWTDFDIFPSRISFQQSLNKITITSFLRVRSYYKAVKYYCFIIQSLCSKPGEVVYIKLISPSIYTTKYIAVMLTWSKIWISSDPQWFLSIGLCLLRVIQNNERIESNILLKACPTYSVLLQWHVSLLKTTLYCPFFLALYFNVCFALSNALKYLECAFNRSIVSREIFW